MPERRYSDDEVATIFARASEAERDALLPTRSAEGLTLGDLQAIGREAGIAPELVAQAARSLDQPIQTPPATFLGLPVAVARTVSLDRRLTDAEWERLVVDLRETFQARGVIRTEGSFRHWANGNLQVLLEPDGDRQRVRFRTLNGQARALMLGGLGLLGVSLATTLAAVLTGSASPADALGKVGVLALIGGGIFAWGALRLPGWARLRRKQMEELSDRLTQLP